MKWSRVAFGVVLLACSLASVGENAPEAHGRQIFDMWCAPCHGAGAGMPGTMALIEKYHGALPGPLALRTDLTPEQVRYYVRYGVSVMPPFRKTEITNRDLSDMIEWLRHQGGAKADTK